jgi:hypothetical protein
MSSQPKRSSAASAIAWADLLSPTSALNAAVLGPAIFTVSSQSLTSAARTLALARERLHESAPDAARRPSDDGDLAVGHVDLRCLVDDARSR